MTFVTEGVPRRMREIVAAGRTKKNLPFVRKEIIWWVGGLELGDAFLGMFEAPSGIDGPDASRRLVLEQHVGKRWSAASVRGMHNEGAVEVCAEKCQASHVPPLDTVGQVAAIYLSRARGIWQAYAMKSAYELAMGRLEKAAPSSILTAEQKHRIAEVDREVTAKVAEKKIFLEGQMATANEQECDEIRRQLASELIRLEEKREREKEKIRNEKA